MRISSLNLFKRVKPVRAFQSVRASAWVVSLIASSLIFSSCASSQIRMRENLKQVDYSLQGFQMLTSDEALGLMLKVELKNPLEESMILDSLVSQVYLNGQVLADVKHLNHVKILPGQSQVIDLELVSQLGLTDWMEVLQQSQDKMSVQLKGKAWSKIEYWFWDSLKETDFELTKELDVKAIRSQIQLQIQNSIKKALGLPGDILDPAKQKIFH